MAKWEELPIADRAQYMRVAVQNGYRDIRSIREAYNRYADGGPYSVKRITDTLWKDAKEEQRYGDPTSHYLNTISEEEAEKLGYYKDARGHRDDRVKLETHPSHPNRGKWNSLYEFELSDKGMENPNYTLFGLADGNDPQAIMTYKGGIVLPELTVTPNGNYYDNTYDNIKLKYAEGGNLFEIGGKKKQNKKVGPTYNPKTKTWTNFKGQNITGKSFKGKYGTTTYLDSGAVDLDASSVSGKSNDHRYRYAPNAHRVYIGGNPNEARQKYFDADTELTSTIKTMAKRYGISPSVLASRMAKEGPIDEAIRNYNNTNGYFQRGDMIGPIWGLDDMGTWISKGIVKPRKDLKVYTDVEMQNEKGRTTYSVASDNYMDGVELTAVALRYFKDEMRKKYPKASEAQLEQYATAAFNNGMAGATNLINQGKIQNSYKPFIHIKRNGGPVKRLLTKPY